MTNKQVNVAIIATVVALYLGLITWAAFTHGVSKPNPNKTTAVELLRACDGEIEIIATPTALLIGCAPKQPAAKAPTSGDRV